MDLPSRKAIGGHMNPTTVVVDKTVLLSILAKQAAANGMIKRVPSRDPSIARCLWKDIDNWGTIAGVSMERHDSLVSVTSLTQFSPLLASQSSFILFKFSPEIPFLRKSTRV